MPLEAPSLCVPAETDQRIPHARLPLEAAEGVGVDVVLDRKSADASRRIEILEQPDTSGGVQVDHVRVHCEHRQVEAIAAKGRPEAVRVDAPRAFGGREAAEKGTVQ